MKYHAANTEVKLGDRVIYRHMLFGRSNGVVAYISGFSKPNPRIIENQWVVRLESGKGLFMIYTQEIEYAHRRVIFVSRGANDSEISPNEPI